MTSYVPVHSYDTRLGRRLREIKSTSPNPVDDHALLSQENVVAYLDVSHVEPVYVTKPPFQHDSVCWCELCDLMNILFQKEMMSNDLMSLLYQEETFDA